MKFSIATLTLAAATSAQVITQCGGKAQVCLDEATVAASDCNVGDWACGCQPANMAAIRAAATDCVVAACGGLIPARTLIPLLQSLTRC